jgi:protein TonB
MSARAAIAATPTSGLSQPLAVSVAVHVAVLAGLALWGWWQMRGREHWGEANPGGMGSVTVQTVARIPIASRTGPTNPVANDTESQTPAPPKPQPRKSEPVKEDPDAVALNLKREKRRITDVAASNQRYRPEPPRENQVYSNAGQRAVTPMFGVPGSGGVGAGNTTLGARFGYYEALLRQRIAEKWRTQEIDARIRQLPVAIVTFTIERSGAARNVRVAQSSGNYALDISAQRAVMDASPFPPLPPQFERDSANVEFWFELKR